MVSGEAPAARISKPGTTISKIFSSFVEIPATTDGAPDGGELADGGADSGQVDRCETIRHSVEAAGFGARVTVSCDGGFAQLTGDTYPDHDKMNGITGTNEQVPVPAPGYTSPIALAPVKAAAYTVRDAALGVAVNGVPIYDYTSAGMNDPSTYDAKFDTKAQGQLDHCNGHAGRGDDYHYHAAPTCMIGAMKNQGPDAILGWSFDGFPLYGDTESDGTPIAAGALDVCNGKSDPTFGYAYHTTQAHPYVWQCMVGQVDATSLPRVAAFPMKPPGVVPQGGVQGLVFTENADGSRSMTYSYQGNDYYIRYKPGAQAGCWDFEQKTLTTGGMVETATYCRQAMP